MAGYKIVSLICCFLISECFSWTVDLAEVRKHHFKEEEATKETKTDDKTFIFDNVDNDSPLTRDARLDDVYRGIFRNPKYAEEFEYTAYKEKEEERHQDSTYLEGLRQSIDKYARTLEYCSKQDFSQSPTSDTLARLELACKKATRSREHVRRLAELAMFTTKQLQDLDFQDKYREKDVEREKELLLKLALFLEQLAHYTGFEPRPVEPEPGTTPSTTTYVPPTIFPPLQVPEDVRARLLNCLNMNTSEPATERCAFPLPLPSIVRRLMNLTDSSTDNSTANTTVSSESTNQQPTELLNTASSDHLGHLLPHLHSLGSKLVHKRSIDDDPLTNVLQYYLKYKVWINSNFKPLQNDEKTDYHVENELKNPKNRRKRSIVSKKSIIQRIPEDPEQILKPHLKGNHNSLTDAEKRVQLEKIKEYLDKIHHSAKTLTVDTAHSHDLVKRLLTKRSIYYEPLIRPVPAQDPYQDLSRYVKNKPGTEMRPNILQVAQARAGLQRVFETGDKETVRKYAANYKPINQIQYLAGVIKSISDV